MKQGCSSLKTTVPDAFYKLSRESFKTISGEMVGAMSISFPIVSIYLAHLQSSVFKLSKDLIDSIHEEGIVAYTS